MTRGQWIDLVCLAVLIGALAAVIYTALGG